MLKIGDEVELKESVKFVVRVAGEFAKIEAFLPSIEGGVYLSNRIGGFRYWNVADLKRRRTPRAIDAGDSATSQTFSNAGAVIKSDGSAVPTQRN